MASILALSVDRMNCLLNGSSPAGCRGLFSPFLLVEGQDVGEFLDGARAAIESHSLEAFPSADFWACQQRRDDLVIVECGAPGPTLITIRHPDNAMST